MPARITIRAELATLLAKAQAATDANRQAQRQREADVQADRKRLEAKKAKEEAARKKALEDPVGRQIRTAAMGSPSSGASFPGFYAFNSNSTKTVVKVRSGVKALAASGIFEEVQDSPSYANQVSVVSFANPQLPEESYPVSPEYASIFAQMNLSVELGGFYLECPEFAALIAEIAVGPRFIWITEPGGEPGVSGWTYINRDFAADSWEKLVYRPLTDDYDIEEYRAVQIGVTGGTLSQADNDVFIESLLRPDGAPVGADKFRFYYATSRSISLSARAFNGSIFTASYEDLGAGFNELVSSSTIPLTGGVAAVGPMTYGPVAYGWEIASTQRTPAFSSVVVVGTSDVDAAALASGDLSVYPEASPPGSLIQALTPDLSDPIYETP